MSPPANFFEEQPDPIATQPRDDGGLQQGEALRPDRPNYATGALLDAEDFKAEQLYHRARLAEALFYLGSSGTLAGLRVVWRPAVAPDPNPALPQGREEEIEVQPGLALDRFGRLIEVTRPACLRLGRWLEALQAPVLHGPPVNGIVADVFIRFVAAPRGYTPAYAAAPFDATDAIMPSRIRDSYQLALLPRTEVGQLEANLPIDPWAGLGDIADLGDRQQALQELILNGWRGGTDQWDSRGPIPLPEHVDGQDTTALFLARVSIPATLDGDNRLTRTTGDVRVQNELRQFVYSTAALAQWAGLRPNPA